MRVMPGLRRVGATPRALRRVRGVRYVRKSVPTGTMSRGDDTMTAMRDLRQEQQVTYLPFVLSSYPPVPAA